MAKYRKISPKIWNDAKFRTLSDNAKLVFFMLLTHPQTSAIGTLRAFPQGLAPEMGWSEEAFRAAFNEAFHKGMVRSSEKDGLIWLPNFMKHNAPESPNVLKSWAGALDECPECSLKDEIFHSVQGFAQSLSKAFAAAFSQAFCPALPNQEQEQEQEEAPPVPPAGDGVYPDRGRATRFVPPQVPEVAAYCAERGNDVDARAFCDFYASKGWRVGRSPMKDWRAAVRTWENGRRSAAYVLPLN